MACDEGALFLLEARRSPPLSPKRIDCLPRRSFNYRRLPHDLFLKLTILKLDGSSFDVQVMSTASVLELKQAVEEFFSRSPGEDDDDISWSLVWGHFCLSYKSYKLVNDKDALRTFGVQDGDQLCFARHLSMNNIPVVKKQQRNQNTAFRGYSLSLTGPIIRGTNRKAKHLKDVAGDQDEKSYFVLNDPETDIIGHKEFKLVHLLRHWLTHARCWSSGRKRSRKGWVRVARLRNAS
ncbi:hypothetical protein H6P81_001229 [Aristolochia fimbriata]|uniref:SNRNP25 ubiquitin-like domain-containing protein n=1 Tax=Aristolochia fimbriata TaxID=158543 RepID=A0AAV7FA61_ARIFI|nr:hypothetical protein H6P81_001229 [Aristolochia fimbriata]